MQEIYIKEAIKEAKKALELGEVPVGAIIVNENRIIGRGFNLKEKLNDVTAHAEIIAIKQASKFIENWRLSECSMYVTLEPCPMCISAIIQSRIKNLYIGTFDPTSGACGSVINLANNDFLRYNINVKWLYNIECSKILEQFFTTIRMKNKIR